jgi:hypothetical protein
MNSLIASAGGRLVTVCIAALAGHGRTIVCVADKAVSYGDHIQWDADSSKITTLDNNKSLILLAGSEDPTSRVLRKLDSLREEFSGDRAVLVTILEEKFKEAFAEEQEITILHPQMMTREDYLKAISGGTINRYMESLALDVRNFRFDCALLVCGFDNKQSPYIILLEPPGKAIDCTITGFAAIGTGAEKAISELLYAEYARSHGVARALYDCFDAKLFAEMAPGVGYEWEMRLITAAKAVPLHSEAKPLLERVWVKYSRSPFEKRKKGDSPDPPKDWQNRLKTLVAASLQGCEPSEVRSIDEIAEG